jgi:peptide/nickel transport system ATP-binding protein
MSAAASMHEMTVASAAGGDEIISDISLELSRGEILGLVGESGSGKSTLALAFLWHTQKGLTRARGSVTLTDVRLADLDASTLRRMRGRAMAYVPQTPRGRSTHRSESALRFVT